ncbi:MAG: hypothetical protein M3325_16055 [Actinomycetota bacterium]|nr:hypothetical protein [Actinomycetota bacterium]
MIDSIADIGAALTKAQPQNLTALYDTLRLQMIYDPSSQTVDVTIQPHERVNNARVRGGTRPLRTRPQPTETPGSGIVRSFGTCGCLSIWRASAMVRRPGVVTSGHSSAHAQPGRIE